jgi:predicted nucleic acid-binding protein
MASHPLPALAAGTGVVIDANIFIYALTGRSLQCRELLERAQSGDVVGLTTIEVVNEICHRLMLLEALERRIIGRISASALRSKANEIASLTSYWRRIEQIFDLNLNILILDLPRVRRAHRLRSAHGLLTNDSLIVAAAEESGIPNLASNDRDFERVGSLTLYRPTDLA